MNLNLIAYSVYLPIISLITIKTGWSLYKNGKLFLANLFNNDKVLVQRINKILLMGYYLVNLGYAIITISYWAKIKTEVELINSLTFTLGKLILILAILHYNNIFWLKQIQKTNLLNQ
ncbi:hypothetical protein [Aureibaculum conchae]|uniref:hypothetical protein n=1 Tax=Aureibaculum sp. 2308TA14-22 TaxID=3108392 RepID=UPI00339795A3